jgi:hypothetical protein
MTQAFESATPSTERFYVASNIKRFRRTKAVQLAPGGHGWAHGQRESAEADARWLSENFGLPIRSAAS